DRSPEHAAKPRQIAREQLILQRARAGRDDHAAPGVEHGHEIRERLADPGAGLDRDVRAALDRVGDDPGHPGLRLSVREPGQTPSEKPRRAEEMRKLEHRRTIPRIAGRPARRIGAASQGPRKGFGSPGNDVRAIAESSIFHASRPSIRPSAAANAPTARYTCVTVPPHQLYEI